MPEAHVIINGVALTQGQAMTIRVALVSFQEDLLSRGPVPLGNDLHGRRMTESYLANARAVLDLMMK